MRNYNAMDFSYLANILLRRKWLLLSVVLVSSIATWFLVGKLPPVYKAKTVISTGIIDYKGVSLQKDNPFIQQFQIESSFNGLIEKMKSRSSVKTLTDKLLQHDLDPVNQPFRLPDAEEAGLTQSEFDNLALTLKTSNPDTGSLAQPPVETYSNKLPEAYEYDYESLLKKLDIKRIGETDYLSVEFESESPELSFFAVNAFIQAFFDQHEIDLSQEEKTSVAFHTKQVTEKKKELDSKIEEINNYKRANGLVDVMTQRESVIGHLKDLELKKEEASQEIEGLQRAIPVLEAKIQEYTKYMGNDYASNLYLSEDFNQLSKE
ncbi:MAG: Wzz/FepE/Etk N-terminal domain-containing protein, partial [Bacteroidota bacterium]